MSKRTFLVELAADGDDQAVARALLELIWSHFQDTEASVTVTEKMPSPFMRPMPIVPQDSPQFKIRMPEALRAQIATIASANGRSMNAEIVYRLIKSLEADGFRLPEAEEDAA
jgi:hypothetical protein